MRKPSYELRERVDKHLMSNRHLMRLKAAAVCVTAILAGCSELSGLRGAAVRDSAGVRIVEYPAAPSGESPIRVASEPLYRHGHLEGHHEFARISFGALFPDGRAVVVDVGSGPGAGQDVLMLAPGGQLPGRVARGGQGPTEVRSVLSLTVLPGDTLVVEDDGNGKVMYFADTAFVRSISVAPEPTMVRALRILGFDEEGRALMHTSSFSTNFTTPWLAGQLVRAELPTLTADTVGSYDMAAMRTEARPWTPFTPEGSVTASAREFVHGRSDVPAIVWRRSDGSVRQILRWTPELRYPTEADKQLYLETNAAELRRINPQASPERLEQMIAARADIDIPTDVPVPLWRYIRGDGEGGVWLAEFQPASGRTFIPRYYAVDADGRWRGAVEIPQGLRVLDVAHGYVLGVLTDGLGVESVAVFELLGR